LVRSWHETGELPLWCPYNYTGVAFFHDPQTAALYPLHLPLYLLPEKRIGAALSWLVVLHVAIAGWTMLGYARSRGLGRAAAFAAAAGFMLAGKWLAHLLAAGQYVQVGLAWLPLVLLFFERAIARKSAAAAGGAGAVFALIALSSHPQLTAYAGALAAAWSLIAAASGPRKEKGGPALFEKGASERVRSRPVLRWLGYGAIAGSIAVAISAIALLPALEASRESSRWLGVEDPSGVFWRRLFLGLVGPPLVELRLGEWENQGYLGLLWVAAAAAAAVAGRRRTRAEAALFLGLLAFALGGGALVHSLPGLRFFRFPARALIVAAFPLAFLGARAGETLFGGDGGPSPEALRRGRRAMLFSLSVCLALPATACTAILLTPLGPRLEGHAYWAILPVSIAAALGAFRLPARAGRPVFCGALVLDALALALPLPETRAESEIYPASPSLAFLAGRRGEHGRVLDRDPPGFGPASPLGTGAPLAVLAEIEPLRGYKSLDILRYKEFLQLLGDRDGPLRAASGLTLPGVTDFPVTNKALLDLIGARWLLVPRAVAPRGKAWRKVLEDPAARAYLILQGGVQALPPFSLYENLDAFPRAFVVPEAAPLPERKRWIEAARRVDFRRTALLEDPRGKDHIFARSGASGELRAAKIRAYAPNRVAIDIPDGPAGVLVFTDPWFPGWRASVDGKPARVFRANFLFRAVLLSPGPHEVVFRFRPDSLVAGAIASGAGLLVLMSLFGGAILTRRARHV
jgi:hypothetical protein